MTPPELKLNTNLGSTIGGAIGGSIGNNPFGGAGADFINCIFQGGNFWDTMGQSAANLGMQAAGLAMNSIFNAVGGAITSGISLATEKAKNKASEAKIAKENKAAENAAKQGAAQTEALINEAAGKIEGYKADLDEQIKMIEESTAIVEAKKEEMLENIKLIQELITVYETEKAKRDKIQEKLNSTTDEEEKAKLQQELTAANEMCATYAPTINELDTNITASADAIAQEISKAADSQEFAGEIQEQLETTTVETQTNVDNTVVTTNNSVVEHTGAAAQETATLNSNATTQKIQGEQMLAAAQAKSVIPGLGTAIGAVDTAVAHGLITTGTTGKGSAQQLAGIVQAFGSNYTNNFAGAENALPEINTNIENIGIGTETLTAMVETNIAEGTEALETERPENPVEEEKVNIV